MNRVHYSLVLLPKGGGDALFLKEGYIVDDKFQALVQGDGLARISTTYQRQMKFAEEKVMVTITCACDQNESTLDRAGELTFRKALELVDSNYGLLMEMAQQEGPKI